MADPKPMSIDDLLKGPQVTINLDALNMAGRDAVSATTHGLLSRMQNEKPHIQVLGAAVLFAAITRRLGLNAEEMYHKASRILRDVEFDKASNHRFAALRAYAAGELAEADRER